jgi:hypothetical protein
MDLSGHKCSALFDHLDILELGAMEIYFALIVGKSKYLNKEEEKSAHTKRVFPPEFLEF